VQIAETLKPGTMLHLAPLFPEDIEIGNIKSLDLKNVLICLDVQGLLRGVKGKKIFPKISTDLTEALRTAHVVKANEKELELILKTHEKDLNKLIRTYDIKEFIGTFGSKGGFIKSQNGDTFTYNAVIPKTFSDPTGAGDVFFAAYILNRFHYLKSIEESACQASSVAARHVSGEFILPEQLMIRH
jgi:fructose-1-phosphate kinase PfkB-like protein